MCQRPYRLQKQSLELSHQPKQLTYETICQCEIQRLKENRTDKESEMVILKTWGLKIAASSVQRKVWAVAGAPFFFYSHRLRARSWVIAAVQTWTTTLADGVGLPWHSQSRHYYRMRLPHNLKPLAVNVQLLYKTLVLKPSKINRSILKLQRTYRFFSWNAKAKCLYTMIHILLWSR